jgi:hypothetical protein
MEGPRGLCIEDLGGWGVPQGPQAGPRRPAWAHRCHRPRLVKRDRQAVEASGSGGWGVPVELSLWMGSGRVDRWRPRRQANPF